MSDAGLRPENGPNTNERGGPAIDAGRSSAPPPLLVFAGALLLATATFGSSFALLVRSDTVGAVEEAPARTSVPTRAATAAPSPVRITGASGTAEKLASGAYGVTFTWTLEGGREGDSVLLRFSAGGRVLSEQRGALDATVFTSSTGTLTIATSQACSADGWSAEVVSVRGLAPVGDAVSRVAGVTCP